jgi:hypothetical protein
MAAMISTAGSAGCMGGDSNNGGSTANNTTTTTTETGTNTNIAASTETQATTPVEGGTGSLEVIESELAVEKGQNSTDIAMTGLLENTGRGTLRIPEIDVRFYDDRDAVLDSVSHSIVFLEPGDRWDVRISYFQDRTPARGEIKIGSSEVLQTEFGIPDPIELTEENLETGTDPKITARLQNTSDNPIDVAAFGVFYAEETVALGDGFDLLNGLAAGESWAVSLESLITSDERAQRVTDHTLYANVP